MAPPASTSSSSDRQPSQPTGAQGSGLPAQSPINDMFDQSDNLNFLSALTGDPEDSSGPSNNNSDELKRNTANNLVKFLLRYADKELLDQALSTRVRGQGSRQRRSQATTLFNQPENNRNAEEIEV